ncbi:hypothetical protein EI42_05993 [Thermosporothrix hazakensis]|jgi:dynactin complex subunit|uniref:Uncharacterized protein n=2 Tax=Thermosporothrix TaxID=768650 RepID=A0A326U2P7_THEHA|nr:hypothetical protein [Thermosporothrix hazakensis]BBH90133.1 hypothetical protein KTC_48840 [Thermosporothrix sp. COM3]PZW19684.1 hypothetical protein EI42_05993 [Thermosporothrix hazakensis]BBH90198.1 hypothetical protein KTC_49490 [Thermosporothrix sp. COM3]BBH90263.1 hypothetical protein KTC_50140 [Thermosporothrix sp. COM3]GCE49204.1 hypothetical protein KTH_40730 [Thermosporothrix hazakensis]
MPDSIQQQLAAIYKKIDELPSSYVNLKTHEVQIRMHEQMIQENQKRIDNLESQLSVLRKEWGIDLKEANSRLETMKEKFDKQLDDIQSSSQILAERFIILSRTLYWLLGVLSSILIAVIIAYLTRFIH